MHQNIIFQNMVKQKASAEQDEKMKIMPGLEDMQIQGETGRTKHNKAAGKPEKKARFCGGQKQVQQVGARKTELGPVTECKTPGRTSIYKGDIISPIVFQCNTSLRSRH